MVSPAVMAPLLILLFQALPGPGAPSFEASFQRGLVAFANGDPAAALAAFEEALAIQPDHTQARFHLARALRETGSPERALRELRAIEARMVDRFGFLLSLARTHEDLKQLAAAKEALLEAGRLRPNAARVPYLLGELLASEGKLGEALESMEKAASLQPDWVQPHRREGELALVLGDAERAVRSLERAAELAPEAPLVLVSLGDAYGRAGRREDAVRTWRGALQLKPDMPKVQAQIGNVLFATGSTEEAFAAFRAALALDPEDLGVRTALSLSLFSTGRTGEAEEELLEIQKRAPGSGLAFYYLGVIAASRGEPGLARERLEAALPALEGPEGELAILAGRAGESHALRIAARVELGEILLRSEDGDVGRAIELLEDAVTSAPDHASARYQLGIAYRRLGRREDAARELALFKQINDAREHDQLALKAIESGDEEKAVSELEAALAIYPADRVAHGELARLMLKRGENDRAARHLEHVVEYADSPESAVSDLLRYYCEQGNRERARALFQRASDRGIPVPGLCLERP